jgi:hypothetical protein
MPPGNRTLHIIRVIYDAQKRLPSPLFRDQRHSFERPIFLTLVQLAIAILYELGLDKAASHDPALILAYDLKGLKKPSILSRSPTMEERRALLSCFLISSLYGIPSSQSLLILAVRPRFSRKAILSVGQHIRMSVFV